MSTAPVDEQVNKWIKSEDIVVLSVHPETKVSEKVDNLNNSPGQRTMLMRYVVVYMPADKYFESESHLRQATLAGIMQGMPTPEAVAPAPPAPPPARYVNQGMQPVTPEQAQAGHSAPNFAAKPQQAPIVEGNTLDAGKAAIDFFSTGGPTDG